MAGYKAGRITSDIKMMLSDILRDVKDPRVSRLLSIVKVDVSGDLSYATVYVSAIEGYDKTVESVKALKNAAGFIRREVCKKVKMRRSPEFRFIADDSIEYSAGIYKMLDDLNISTADDEEE